MEIQFRSSQQVRPNPRPLNKGESALLADLREADVFKPGEAEELGLIPKGSSHSKVNTQNLKRQAGFASFGTLMTLGGLGLAVFGQSSALRVAGVLAVFAGLHEQRWERGEDIHGGFSDIHAGRHVDIHAGRHVDIHAGRHADIHAGRHADIHAGRHVDIHAGRHADIHAGRHADIHAGRHADIHAGRHADIHAGRHADIHAGRHADIHPGRRVDIHPGRHVDIHPGRYADIHGGRAADIH